MGAALPSPFPQIASSETREKEPVQKKSRAKSAAAEFREETLKSVSGKRETLYAALQKYVVRCGESRVKRRYIYPFRPFSVGTR